MLTDPRPISLKIPQGQYGHTTTEFIFEPREASPHGIPGTYTMIECAKCQNVIWQAPMEFPNADPGQRPVEN